MIFRLAGLALLLVNALAYLVYWWDKRRSEKGGRRISEKELLMWAGAGGSLGAFLAMRRFRHKTQKRSFRIAFWSIVALQVGGVFLLFYLR